MLIYKNEVTCLASLARYNRGIATPYMFLGGDNNNINAIGLPYNKPANVFISNVGEDGIQFNTIGELFDFQLTTYIPEGIRDLIKEISEEEFYNTSI